MKERICKYCKTPFTDIKMYNEHMVSCTVNPRNKTCETCKFNSDCKYKQGYKVKIACLDHVAV